MTDLAIIGSQDVALHEWLTDTSEVRIAISDRTIRATTGKLNGCNLIVLPRNGTNKPMPPHLIDYRSNIEAIVETGASRVLTTSMVGTLKPIEYPNGSMCVLDQFIDFTKDRQFSFFANDHFGFADMTEPFCKDLRQAILRAGQRADVKLAPNGCYIGVPGPRFETAAEVRMYAAIGGDVIGHTTVTDCVMAREAGLCFATVAGVITVGAGLSDHRMSAPLWHGFRQGHSERFRKIVDEITKEITGGFGVATPCTCATATPIERPDKAMRNREEQGELAISR